MLEGYSSGKPLAKKFKGRTLKENRLALMKLAKSGPLDLRVSYSRKKPSVPFRLLMICYPNKKDIIYLVTNLAAEKYTVKVITTAYCLRWQIELLFKEWKSYSNLHKFHTKNAAIAEGLIWSSLAAAILKRYLALLTQRLKHVDISTQSVAKCAGYVMEKILISGFKGSIYLLKKAIDSAIKLFAHCAKRSRPDRDRKTGRLQLGLVPVMGA